MLMCVYLFCLSDKKNLKLREAGFGLGALVELLIAILQSRLVHEFAGWSHFYTVWRERRKTGSSVVECFIEYSIRRQAASMAFAILT